MKERSNTYNDRFDDSTDARISSQSDGRPFSRIFQDILNHVTEIIRSEVRLARTEVRQDVKQVSKASVFLIIGAVFALYALGFVLLGVVSALETRLAPWLSAVIVGSGAGVLALIFLQIGRTKIKQVDLKPDRTLQSLQENVTWMKKQTR